MPGLDSYLFCLTLNFSEDNKNALLVNNSIFGGGLGGGHTPQAISYTPPSELPLWHKPERLEDLFRS